MTTTLQELLVQQAELSAQLAEFERPLVQEAHDILTGTAATDLAAALSTIHRRPP